MAKKRFYEGEDTRRAQEQAYGSLIHEAHGQMANLPQEVMIKPFPGEGAGMPENYDDTIHGIDAQISFDKGKAHKGK